jgi:hypothetical protein
VTGKFRKPSQLYGALRNATSANVFCALTCAALYLFENWATEKQLRLV